MWEDHTQVPAKVPVKPRASSTTVPTKVLAKVHGGVLG